MSYNGSSSFEQISVTCQAEELGRLFSLLAKHLED